MGATYKLSIYHQSGNLIHQGKEQMKYPGILHSNTVHSGA